MADYIIAEVIRKDNFAIVVFVECLNKLTSFYIEDRLTRRGLPVPEQAINQVRAIFRRNKKLKPIKAPKNLRPINTKHLQRRELKRLMILRNAGIEYLEEGWIKINYGQKYLEQTPYSPRIIRDIHTAIRMQLHIEEKFQNQKLNSREKNIVNTAKVRRQLLIQERIILENQACQLNFRLQFIKKFPTLAFYVLDQIKYLINIAWVSPFCELCQKKKSFILEYIDEQQ
ncbi:MAG: hypothetical protein ABH830_04780 [Patescibacteria group bacterium]